MSETATEHVEHVVHEGHDAPTNEAEQSHELGNHDARICALEEQVRGLCAAQASTEEDVERVEDEVERAEETAIEARIDAAEAEQTAEVAEAVAVAAAEVAIEAEETAEEVEDEITEVADDTEGVTEVEATEEAPSTPKRSKRRGLYGRR